MKKYLFIYLVSSVFLMTACTQLNYKDKNLITSSSSASNETYEGDIIKIVAVGDIQMGRAWPREKLPINGPDILFSNVSSYFQNKDIVFGNLETVLADEGESKKCRTKSSNCFAFRVPSSYGDTLKEMKFNLLSINNNHALDFGLEGVKNTSKVLSNTGIKHSGNEVGPVFWEEKNVRYSMLAFSTSPGAYRIQDIETGKEQVRNLAENSDVVIVSFHGGAEGRNAQHVPKEKELFYGEDRGDVYLFSRAMIDAGADIVIGHGPHVLRAVEVYNNRLIAYSLGNFTAWETFNLEGTLGLSAILNVDIYEDGFLCSVSVVPIKIDWPGIPSFDEQGRAHDLFHNLSTEDLGVSFLGKEGKYHSDNERCLRNE